MTYEQIRMILAKLGIDHAPPPNTAGWLHIACPYAPWRHRGGVDRSRGFAIKVEDNGISAFKCPACKAHGRISGLARGLSHFRGQDYSEIEREADKYDMLGNTLPSFEEQFGAPAVELVPLDEALFNGLFDPIANHNEAKRYVLSRNITRHTVEKLNIEFDPEKRRIVFPVRDADSNLYGWSGRTVIPDHKPKVLDYAGLPKRNLIMGEERWRSSKPKLLVEGLIAFARMHEIGAEEYVDIGALLGSWLTEEKAARLIGHGCNVLPLMDPDKAGDICLFGQWNEEDAAFEGGGLIDQLAGEIPVLLPLYPQGVKDPDDLNINQLKHMIDTAQLQGVSKAWVDKKSQGR